MNGLYEKYFSCDQPEQERMFHLISGLLIIGFATCLYVSIFYAMPWYIRALVFCGLFLMIGLFFEDLSEISHYNLCVFLIYLAVLIIFPTFYVLSKGEALEAPLYYVSGIVISAYLVADKWRAKAITLQLVIYLGSFLMVFLFFSENISLDTFQLTMDDYLRIFVGIAINGGYCGIVAYYRNRLIHEQMVKASEAMEEARNYGYSKDVFLVNVSHDIRTPLNAIIGTCELIQDKEMTEETQENIEQILNFSKALLSITNNLLDFSKMDMTKITLEEKKYEVTEMLNEIINMFAVQLLDSGIDFYPMIEANIPKGLIGDQERIYQVMTNLISHAVKTTEEGDILFKVAFEKIDEQKGRLVFSVQDGSKCEHTDEMLAAIEESELIEREQENSIENKNRIVSDAYLEVVNARRVSKAMGGFLRIESENGKGDILTVIVPQRIENSEPIAILENKEESFVALCKDEMEREHFQFIFSQLKVPYSFVNSQEEFLERIRDEKITRGFLSQFDLIQISEPLQNEFVWFKLVLIGERNRSSHVDRKVPSVVRPFHVMSVCDALSGQKTTEMKRRNRYSAYRCPSAKIMVVDDNQINLEVAGGMLERIGAQVTCVLSGQECLKKLETEDYDVILMDYMMPEMDGIDTLKNIKMMERRSVLEIPIIALTANAVSGSREMFLEAGFDDYISKPIEMKSFYVMIRKYLKPEQLEFN